MQHRITLSTDLLIAVRDSSNKAKELQAKRSVEGIMISKEKYKQHIESHVNEEWHFTLYGHEHAKAV
jgi:hypothetical protein